MKKALLSLAIAFSGYHVSAQNTTLTVDANDVLNSNNKIIINTPVGQSFFTAHQVGTGYSYSSGIFRAITDNPTYGNYFYDGLRNGTVTYSVRSDGQGYFAGNVGIGTASPGSNLSIRGTSSGLSIHCVGSGYYGSLAFNREAATGTIFDPTGNAFQINNGNGTDKNLHIQVYSNSGSYAIPDALTINGTNGAVGINTAAMPAGYQFAVNGAAIATSMTVKSYSQWGDYIFDKAYQLPTLDDVKSYIAQNHHLPDMPSAQEIADKGINLGDIVTTQTKKIEELTLYLIDKDKQDKEKDAKIQEQQNLLKQQQDKSKQQDERIKALEQALIKLSKAIDNK